MFCDSAISIEVLKVSKILARFPISIDYLLFFLGMPNLFLEEFILYLQTFYNLINKMLTFSFTSKS